MFRATPFPRTGRACNQEMRNFGQIGKCRSPQNVLTQAHCQFVFGLPEFPRGEHFLRKYGVTLDVGNLDAYNRFSRYRGDDADTQRGQGRARSSARPAILETLIPGAGSYSKLVMTGPVFTSLTFPTTPNSFSVCSRSKDFSRMSASSTISPPETGPQNIQRGKNVLSLRFGASLLLPPIFRLRI